MPGRKQEPSRVGAVGSTREAGVYLSILKDIFARPPQNTKQNTDKNIKNSTKQVRDSWKIMRDQEPTNEPMTNDERYRSVRLVMIPREASWIQSTRVQSTRPATKPYFTVQSEAGGSDRVESAGVHTLMRRAGSGRSFFKFHSSGRVGSGRHGTLAGLVRPRHVNLFAGQLTRLVRLDLTR